MNRGADRQDIFSTDDDRLVFERHLGEIVAAGQLEIHAYVLMSNHYHLLGRSPLGEVSSAMHRLGSEYARWYNQRHRRDGPLFRNRFVSVPVRSDTQALVVARYIHRNPLAIVPERALDAYRWSSLGLYTQRRAPVEWVRRDVIGALAGDADAHLEFVRSAHPSDADHAAWAPFRPPVELDDIERVLAAITGSDPTSSDVRGRRRSDGFVALVTLAVELRVESAEHLAARLGLPSPGAVRTVARRGRVRLVDDGGFARLCEAARSVLLGPRAA